MRLFHMNTARMIFVFVLMHILRNLFFVSYKKSDAWSHGWRLYLTIEVVSFLGYVLPWGQMSFWGSSVITGMLTVIPFCGWHVLFVLWGGLVLDRTMLTLVFSLHMLLAGVMVPLVVVHFYVLHRIKSRNKLFLRNVKSKTVFMKYLIKKDSVNVFVVVCFVLVVVVIVFVVQVNVWLVVAIIKKEMRFSMDQLALWFILLLWCC